MVSSWRALFSRHPQRRRGIQKHVASEQLEVRALLSALSKGGIVSGFIQAGGEVDHWTFSANEDDRFEIITSSAARTSGFSAYAQVYAPSGDLISSFWSGNNVVLDLPSTGTYTLAIRDDNYTQNGSYTIGLEGISPISPGSSTLVKGGVVKGSIARQLEKDQWTFTGNIGNRFELITTSTARTQGFEAYAEVFAPSGTRVAGFWAGNNVILDLNERGRYMLQIRDNNFQEDGSYSIGLEGISPRSPGAISLVKGGIARGSISTPLEKDQFTLTGRKGDRYELITTSTARTDGFSAYTQVFSPDGSLVTGFWAGNNVVIDFDVSGTYLVQIRDDNYTQDGTYTIGLEGIKPFSPGPSTLLKGKIVGGFIGTAIEKDQWVFSGKVGERYEIITAETPRTPGFAAYTQIYAPSGTLVASFWAGNNVTLDLSENGNYLVQIRDDNYSQDGYYKIGLESISPVSPGGRTLTAHATVNRSITTVLQKDQWLFTVPSGKKLVIEFSSTALDQGFVAYAEIYTSRGAKISSVWPGKNTITVPAGGKYLIQLRDSGFMKRGDYSLKVWFI